MNIQGSYISSLYSSTQSGGQSAARIASGQRINSASDDAAGLAIANDLAGEVRSAEQGMRNANDGISLLQTAEAGLQNINDGLARLRELALQASNGTLADSDREAINREAQSLKQAMQNEVERTTFNKKSLLAGEGSTSVQLGDSPDQQLDLQINNFDALFEDSGFNDLDFSSAKAANQALSALDAVQGGVDDASANVGAQINRLDSSLASLANTTIQSAASKSRIADADMAKEISLMLNQQVKQEASIAMQVLANQNKGSVLRLLGA